MPGAENNKSKVVATQRRTPMRPSWERQALLALAFLLLSLSCCAEEDQAAEHLCGSLETRSSLLRIYSDDQNNALVTYALRSSNSFEIMMNAAKSDIEKVAILDSARKGASYSLDDTILMKSRDEAAREVTCIGVLTVTALDASATKEIEFRVKQATGRSPMVSVTPFRFKVSPFVFD
jgi:hypothetical protein